MSGSSDELNLKIDLTDSSKGSGSPSLSEERKPKEWSSETFKNIPAGDMMRYMRDLQKSLQKRDQPQPDIAAQKPPRPPSILKDPPVYQRPVPQPPSIQKQPPIQLGTAAKPYEAEAVPSKMGSFMQALQSSSALPAFTGSLVASATGSATLGGIAGTAAGALPASALAAAAPIVAITTIASELVNKFGDTLQTVASTVGGIPGSIGTPATSGIASIANSGILDPLEALTGINLGILDEPIKAFLNYIDIVSEGLATLAKSLEAYSPDIGMALAQEDLYQVQAEMRRASVFGPESVEFIHTRGELNRTADEIKFQISRVLMPDVDKILKILTDILNYILKFPEALVDSGVLDLLKFLANFIPLGGPFVQKILKYIEEIAENTREDAPWSEASLLAHIAFTGSEALEALGFPVPETRRPAGAGP